MLGNDTTDYAQQLGELSYKEVQAECKRHQISAKGSKDALVQSLIQKVARGGGGGKYGHDAGWKKFLFSTPSENDIRHDMKVPDLQALLRQHHLKCSGSKAELVERLCNHYGYDPNSSAGKRNAANYERHVDQAAQQMRSLQLSSLDITKGGSGMGGRWVKKDFEAECRKRGLSHTGNIAELQSRLGLPAEAGRKELAEKGRRELNRALST